MYCIITTHSSHHHYHTPLVTLSQSLHTITTYSSLHYSTIHPPWHYHTPTTPLPLTFPISTTLHTITTHPPHQYHAPAPHTLHIIIITHLSLTHNIIATPSTPLPDTLHTILTHPPHHYRKPSKLLRLFINVNNFSPHYYHNPIHID
jgi:hypothetical protein